MKCNRFSTSLWEIICLSACPASIRYHLTRCNQSRLACSLKAHIAATIPLQSIAPAEHNKRIRRDGNWTEFFTLRKLSRIMFSRLRCSITYHTEALNMDANKPAACLPAPSGNIFETYFTYCSEVFKKYQNVKSALLAITYPDHP